MSRGNKQKPRVIAVCNHKGGVGKTTTASTVAIGLAIKGKKVLLIDADMQGNGIEFFADENAAKEKAYSSSKVLGISPVFGLYDYLLPFLDEKETKIDFELVLHVYEKNSNLHILAGTGELADLGNEITAKRRFAPEMVMSEALAEPQMDYDYVIIDTAPSRGVVNVNVNFYADELLIPIYLKDLTMKSLRKYLEDLIPILAHRERAGQPLQIKYALPTMLDRRYKSSRRFLEEIKLFFGEQLPKTKVLEAIPTCSQISDSTIENEHIFNYAPRSKGAIAYKAVVDQILADEVKAKSAGKE